MHGKRNEPEESSPVRNEAIKKAQVGFECAVPAVLSFAVLDPIHGKAVGVVLGRLLIKGIKNSPSGKWKMIESTQDGLVVRDRLEMCL